MAADGMNCLVVDDQAVVRAGVHELLSGATVTEAASLPEALRAIADRTDLHVAIVAARLPGSDGHGSTPHGGAVRAIRDAAPKLPIVAYDDRPERLLASDVLDAGALAYVAKNSDADELRRAVEAAGEGRGYVDPAVNLSIRAAQRPALTTRQREILQLLADGHSTDSAASHLGLSPETVKTHAKHILAKLEARDRAHAVAIALRATLIE
ncbi:MAG: LuxR C-terminal-related transcriptional regulator [Solirubrobacterales bacterium]